MKEKILIFIISLLIGWSLGWLTTNWPWHWEERIEHYSEGWFGYDHMANKDYWKDDYDFCSEPRQEWKVEILGGDGIEIIGKVKVIDCYKRELIFN